MKIGLILSSIAISMLMMLNVVNAQDLSGHWKGNLEIQGQKLPLVFKFKTDLDGITTGNLDSPNQGAKDLRIDKVFIQKNLIEISMNDLMAVFKGEIDTKNNIIKGTFSQRGVDFPLTLIKSNKEEGIKRPQMPKEPFSYSVEEVSIKNPEIPDVVLAGTLTIPKGNEPFPVVVLVSGSGPQDRDETIMGHKPFWVLADHLSENGIAVLRYDDRGFGKSKGNFAASTTLDFAMDALSVVEFLRTDKRFSEIGVIGHSEGGLIAPIVATQRDDIDFIVMLAGPGASGAKIIVEQVKLLSKEAGLSENEVIEKGNLQQKILDIVMLNKSDKEKAELLKKEMMQTMSSVELDIETANKYEFKINAQISQLLSPWYKFFLKYDPYLTLAETMCPVLALNGSLDLQVPSELNLSLIKKALDEAGNEHYKTVELEGLNHLFQNCKTGAISEYALIEETIAPEVLDLTTNWIKEKIGK